MFKAILLVCCAGGISQGAIYDHYTTQYGVVDNSAASFSFSPGYGNESASSLAPFLQFLQNGFPVGVFTTAIATVGYHDTLIFYGQPTGTPGLLDINYLASSFNGIYDLGGSMSSFTATGFVLPTNHYYQNYSVSALSTVAFQFGVPLSLDGTVTEYASGGSGFGGLQITSLSVEGSVPFLWSDSSGTQYNFTNGQFTPTPEPSTIMLIGLGSVAVIASRVRT